MISCIRSKVRSKVDLPQPDGPMNAVTLFGSMLMFTSSTASTSPPVFMGDGQFAPGVPYAGGDISANALRALGFEVEWHRYPMQHAVCAEEIRDLGDWMTARFAAG